MRTSFFLLLISVLLILSCEKTKYESTGVITERDYRKCMCCGGYFIEIEGTQYNFDKMELPENFTFDDTQLPLRIELNFEPKIDDCTSSGVNWINISKIRKVN